MNLRLRSYVLMLAAAIGINVMASQPVEAASILYGASGAAAGNSSLYTIDTSTGTATLVGGIGFARVNAISFNPISGILYGISNGVAQGDPDFLLTINPTTGAGTQVASLTGATPLFVPDMAFSATGELFAWNEDALDQLATINTTTGAFVNKGASGNTTVVDTGVAFNPAGTLFVKSAQTFTTVNTTTGVASLFSSANGGALNGSLAFSSAGTGYSLGRAVTGGPLALYLLNGALTQSNAVGFTGVEGLDSLAFGPEGTTSTVPEPGSLLLLGTGVGALVRRRRRAAAQ